MIKWMIHLRKQISVAAQSLTPERKINSVKRAGTDTTPEEQSQPDNSSEAAATTLTHTSTHTDAQTTSESHALEQRTKRQHRKMN